MAGQLVVGFVVYLDGPPGVLVEVVGRTLIEDPDPDRPESVDVAEVGVHFCCAVEPVLPEQFQRVKSCVVHIHFSFQKMGGWEALAYSVFGLSSLLFRRLRRGGRVHVRGSGLTGPGSATAVGMMPSDG